MPATILAVDDDHACPIERLVGRSPALIELRETVQRLARGPASPVLFLGETGTGRSLAAQVLHFSDRGARPFARVACAAATVAELEETVVRLDGGTLFLSGVQLAGEPLQEAVRRFLAYRSARDAVGASAVPDIRIMASAESCSNEAPESVTLAGELRERLGAAVVRVPPLRARPSDVEPLVRHYIGLFNGELGKRIERVTPEALEALQAYAWPGNIRELRTVIERAMLVADGDLLYASHLALRGTDRRDGTEMDLPPSGVNLERLERNLVIQALQRTGGNQTRAATLLGLNRDQVRYRIEKFGLPRN